MVITVEPGIYIGEGAAKVPEQFRGIGIRIEDDVVVTADGHRVLTESIPKSVLDVERACAA
jgi:Xaa-Pro aminopeptidase